MTLSSSEALQLVRECIPKMKENKHVPEDFDLTNLCEKHVKVKNICRLWAGMGYIYDVSVKKEFHIIVKSLSDIFLF